MKKILFSSDCNGNFQLLFNKVTLLNQKNKFDLMILVGNVCTIQNAQQFSMICKGQIIVPIPTFFITTGPISKILNLTHPEGGQLAKNFTFLGKSGIKNIQGLNICYFNGLSLNKNISSTSYTSQNYKIDDIEQVLKSNSKNQIDILLTNQWPEEIAKNQSSTIQNFEIQCKKSILASVLSYQLSPKYHLSSSGKTFYRMEPFKSKKRSYTHFINVAQIVRDNLKDKYLLAVQTIPQSLNPPEENIINSVKNPFESTNYQSLLNKNNLSTSIQSLEKQTSFKNEQKRLGFKQTLKMRKNNKQEQSGNFIHQNTYVFFDGVPKDARSDDIHQFLERWGQVTKLEIFKQHKGGFISGIVKFANLQQIKSCLSDSCKYSLYQNRIKFKPKNIEQKYRNQDCWFCQKNDKFDKSLVVYRGKYCIICLDKGPITQYHLQIVPLNHVETIGKLEAIEIEEIQFIKNGLRKYFNDNSYETIITQRYIKLSSQISHTLIQFIAIKQPQQLVHKFYQINQDQRLNFNKIVDEQSWKRKSQFFIKFQINGNMFVKQIFAKDRVEIDLLRKLICEIINKPSKVNWRSCQRNQNQLIKDRQEIKNILQKCNFMIQ